jgi:hypothetical protein
MESLDDRVAQLIDGAKLRGPRDGRPGMERSRGGEGMYFQRLFVP